MFGNTNNHAHRRILDHGRERLRVFDAILLLEAFRNKSRLVLLDRSIRFALDLEHPLGADRALAFWQFCCTKNSTEMHRLELRLHSTSLVSLSRTIDCVLESLLSPEAFINFAFANYPFLHANGLAPALSGVRIDYIANSTRIPALFPLFRLPAEITLEIMRNMKPIDIMRFVLANYQDLARQGITPPLTEETLSQLRRAVRSRLNPG